MDIKKLRWPRAAAGHFLGEARGGEEFDPRLSYNFSHVVDDAAKLAYSKIFHDTTKEAIIEFWARGM